MARQSTLSLTRRFAALPAVLAAVGASACGAQVPAPPRPPIVSVPDPTQRVEGPFQFCAERFSISLIAGEAISWTGDGASPLYYNLHSGNRWIDVVPELPHPEAVETRQLKLENSPVAERVVTALPGAPSSWGIHYLLHGKKRSDEPLDLFFVADDRQAELAIPARVRLGTLAERRCKATWSERSAPAATEREDNP